MSIPFWRTLGLSYSYIWRQRSGLLAMGVPLVVVLGILNGLFSIATYFLGSSESPYTPSLIPQGSEYLLTLFYLPLWGLFSLAWCECYQKGTRAFSTKEFINWIFLKWRDGLLFVFVMFALAAFCTVGSFALLLAPVLSLFGMEVVSFGKGLAGWLFSTPLIVFFFYTKTKRTGDIIIWLPEATYSELNPPKKSTKADTKSVFFQRCLGVLDAPSRSSMFRFDVENKVAFPLFDKIRLYLLLGLSTSPVILLVYAFLLTIWNVIGSSGLAGSATAGLLFGLVFQGSVILILTIIVTVVSIAFGFLFPAATAKQVRE